MKLNVGSVFIILLSALNMSFGDHWYSGCDFVNSKTDSIQLYCSTRDFYHPIKHWDEGCHSDVLFYNNRENRSKVLSLKTEQCDLSTSYYYFEFGRAWLSFEFPNLHSLDISFSGVKELKPEVTDEWQTYSYYKFPQLIKFNASNNEITKLPSDFFRHTSNISDIDFSSNKFIALHRSDFVGASQLLSMNFSNNLIRMLYDRPFGDLVELKILDLSHNRIEIINDNEFAGNSKLENIRLNDNPIQFFACSVFLHTSVLPTTVGVENFDISCLGDSMFFVVKHGDELVLHPFGNGTELFYTKNGLKNVRNFNASGNHLRNVVEIFPLLNESIESMDLASNFIGELTAHTFGKFTNLQHLNLSHTNLSNFGFGTFYSQRKLKVLDISYNRLRAIDFRLFLRNFRSLTTLNLEGNELIEIDTVTPINFPVLERLGISKNLFTCNYLVQFLLEWENLNLMYNPSNGTHIDGVDCVTSEKR